jgi:hypothetical protein
MDAYAGAFDELVLVPATACDRSGERTLTVMVELA